MNHEFIAIESLETNPNLIFYKIQQKGIDEKIVGNMSLIFQDNGSNILLNSIEVKEFYRGFGIGTEILLKLINFAIKFGSKRIFLEVDADNTEAQKLYSRLGFKFNGKINPDFFCYEMEYIL